MYRWSICLSVIVALMVSESWAVPPGGRGGGGHGGGSSGGVTDTSCEQELINAATNNTDNAMK